MKPLITVPQSESKGFFTSTSSLSLGLAKMFAPRESVLLFGGQPTGRYDADPRAFGMAVDRVSQTTP